MDRAKLGSETAKGGFRNEEEIVSKFNNWILDEQAKEWLVIMGYNLDKIESIDAITIPTRIKKADLNKYGLNDSVDYDELTKFKKADAQIKLVIRVGNILKIENISIKKANKNSNYNQIDKRPVTTYQKMWGFDDQIAVWLKLFTGESLPSESEELLDSYVLKEPDKRIYMSEMPSSIAEKIIKFFTRNRILVVSDILRGRGGLAADWMLVTQFDVESNVTTWALKEINSVMNYFGGGNITLSPRGSLSIGRITMQRKGGTPDPTSLQFKFHPCDIFKMQD